MKFNVNEMQTKLLKFVYIDDWNRPVFKVLNNNYYVSDINNLFSYDTTEKQIKEFYKDKELNKYLTYHGSKFDSEPMGTELLEYNLKLI